MVEQNDRTKQEAYTGIIMSLLKKFMRCSNAAYLRRAIFACINFMILCCKSMEIISMLLSNTEVRNDAHRTVVLYYVNMSKLSN